MSGGLAQRADVAAAAAAIVAVLPSTGTLTALDGAATVAANFPCQVGNARPGSIAALAVAALTGQGAALARLPIGTALAGGQTLTLDTGASFLLLTPAPSRSLTLLLEAPAIDLRAAVSLVLEHTADDGTVTNRAAQQVLVAYAGIGVGGGVNAAEPAALAAVGTGSLVKGAPFAVALGDRLVLPDGRQARVASAPTTVDGIVTVAWQATEGALD